jgi:hypothetical protein
VASLSFRTWTKSKIWHARGVAHHEAGGGGGRRHERAEIPERLDGADDLTLEVAERRDAQAHRQHPARTVAELGFEVGDRSPAAQDLQDGTRPGALRAAVEELRTGPADDLRFRVPGDALGGPIDGGDDAVGVEGEHAFPDAVEDCLRPVALALDQLALLAQRPEKPDQELPHVASVFRFGPSRSRRRDKAEREGEGAVRMARPMLADAHSCASAEG